MYRIDKKFNEKIGRESVFDALKIHYYDTTISSNLLSLPWYFMAACMTFGVPDIRYIYRSY